uniref:DLC1 Rho GTPase activating protein n=1 Tax=Varanus komodoensis TaxID=61221 RepID=A0A8D2Q959_VARKO
MSLAIRKRSWEEHVSQWMGLPFSSIDSNILCRHGLVADNLQAGMEKDGLWSEGHKEKSASLPDCCLGGELGGFPSKLLGNVSKEVDENDNHHQEEEVCLSLEDSTETLVNHDDDNNDMELSLAKINDQSTHDEDKLSAESNSLEGGVELCMDVDPREEAKKESKHSYESTEEMNEPHSGTNPKSVMEEGNIWCLPKREAVLEEGEEGREESLELYFAAGASDYLGPSPCSSFLPEGNDLDANEFADSQNKGIPSVPSVEGVADLKTNTAMQQPTDSQVILRKRKEAREDRDQSRLDSMVLLILKLDQLDQDIENALTLGASPSSMLTHTRRHIPVIVIYLSKSPPPPPSLPPSSQFAFPFQCVPFSIYKVKREYIFLCSVLTSSLK